MVTGANAIQNSKCVHLLLIALFLHCFVVGLAGCSAAEEGGAVNTPVLVTADAPSSISVSNSSGLSLTTGQKKYVNPDPKITYSLENSTNITYVYSADSISIEVLQDGKWCRLAFRTDIGDIAYTADAALVLPRSTNTGTISFYVYGDYVPIGTYRLVIGLIPDRIDEVTKEFLVSEFSVIA